ncbi:MAG: FG-GAP-like repeat-containing protein, partial [Phycisphaerae bacterium]
GFAEHVISTSVRAVLSVFAADMDGDGDMDVVSASGEDAKISWYENDGSEVYTIHTISAAPTRVVSVSGADVDGDGDVDVLAASYPDDRIAWYENDGNGGFTGHTISTAAAEARSVCAADVDGDGDLDVVSASGEDDRIAWYENVGGPPTIEAWHSSAEHGEGVGTVLLEVPDDGTFCEPRTAGVTRLVIEFSEAIDPASFTPASVWMAGNHDAWTPVDLSGIVISTSTTNGDTVGVINFAPALPDMGRYLVGIEDITDLAGNPLAGDNDRIFTALVGDALGDLRVNAIDLSYIWANRVFRIDGVTESQTRSDVTCDGRVNAIDLSAAWARRGGNMQDIAPQDLLGWWAFDDALGQIARDRSGNGHHMMVNGATCTDHGRIGGALYFDGDDTVVDDEGGEYVNGLTGFTVAMWIKADDASTDNGIFTVGEPGSSNCLSLCHATFGVGGYQPKPFKAFLSTTDGNTYMEGPGDSQTTAWQHVALTWDANEPDGGPLRLYLDGVPQTSSYSYGSVNGSVDAASQMLVGMGQSGWNHGWEGLIDELRIYDRALSDAEIQDLAWPPAPPESATGDGEVPSLAERFAKMLDTSSLGSPDDARGAAAWIPREANMQNVPDPVLSKVDASLGDEGGAGEAAAVWAEGERVDGLGGADPGRAGPGLWGTWGPRASLGYRRRAEMREAAAVSRTGSDEVVTVPVETGALEAGGDAGKTGTGSRFVFETVPVPAFPELLDVLSLARLTALGA